MNKVEIGLAIVSIGIFLLIGVISVVMFIYSKLKSKVGVQWKRMIGI